MTYEEAETLLGEMLSPLTTEEFFNALGRESLDVKGDANHPRSRLLGEDPKAAILGAYATHSNQLDCHSDSAKEAPPPLAAATDPDSFLALIRSFHQRDYTVRVPDVVPLSPNLQRFVRALEHILHQPVDSSLFWSRAGAKAMIHYDKRDNIIVQLEGRKRWFISTEPPGLQNSWKQIGEPVPHVRHHRVVDAEPGDLMYIPRGTPHTVDSTTESLHLSILFAPVTLRETILAMLDYLSDLDRGFRETAIGPARDRISEDAHRRLLEGVARLLAHCQSPDFVRDAMHLRSSRVIGDLPALPKSSTAPAVTAATRVRHSPLAISHVRHSLGSLDFSQPGGHIAIHPGVERELRYIASTPDFRISDIPGETPEEVRIALVNRLIASGFLEVAD